MGNDDTDWCLYRYRHLVENVFTFLKQYRTIATRYDKLARNYVASLAMICCIRWGEIVVWLRFKLKRSTAPIFLELFFISRIFFHFFKKCLIHRIITLKIF